MRGVYWGDQYHPINVINLLPHVSLTQSFWNICMFSHLHPQRVMERVQRLLCHLLLIPVFLLSSWIYLLCLLSWSHCLMMSSANQQPSHMHTNIKNLSVRVWSFSACAGMRFFFLWSVSVRKINYLDNQALIRKTGCACIDCGAFFY